MITLERWGTFSKRDQIGHIASELNRAVPTEKDRLVYRQILERALQLVDLSLADPKWRDNPLPLFVLRDEIAKVYIGDVAGLRGVLAAI